ncbi:MAG: hypothetical protein P8179_19995 [Candidatus Thiodiazotropha sp.]|jgi:hypothetical protein
MSKVDVNDLVGILKFLDENFLSEEQFSEICNLNVDEMESQKLIAQKVLVPGFNEMNHQTQEHLISSLREIIDRGMDCSLVFERVNTPFDFSSINHVGFVEIVYEEICRQR